MQQCIHSLVPQDNTPRQDHAGLEGPKKKKTIDCDANQILLFLYIYIYHVPQLFQGLQQTLQLQLFSFLSTAQPPLLLVDSFRNHVAPRRYLVRPS